MELTTFQHGIERTVKEFKPKYIGPDSANYPYSAKYLSMCLTLSTYLNLLTLNVI